MKSRATCPDCGGELIQKSRRRLLLVAALLAIAAAALIPFPYVRLAAIPLLVISIYLLVWATAGQAVWCRHCKRFPRRPGR